MFTKDLGLAAPEDISARMLLTNSRGDIVEDKNGDPGWIEFFGPDAEPVRRFRRRVERDQYIKLKKEERRRNKAMTEAEADRELDDLEGMTADGLAQRVKAWRLVSVDGEVVDVPCTIDNVRQLFGDTAYAYLRREAIEFCGDPSNFFSKKPARSSSSPGDISEESSPAPAPSEAT